MIIGTIDYLDFEKDIGYITILTEPDFKEKQNFTPSKVNYNIWLGKLLCIIDLANNIYAEFNVIKHQDLLDTERIKKNWSISIPSNLNCIKYIIDKELDGNTHYELKKLRGIKNLINYNPSRPGDSVNINNIKELISEYKISYSEFGRDKAGDTSKAWITIQTDRPSTLPDFQIDKYFDKLLPKFEFTIAEGEDCMDYKFKSDILRKLKNEIGEVNIEQIKSLCESMTENIKSFAILVYSEKEHASSLWHYYLELRSEIINKYLQKE